MRLRWPWTKDGITNLYCAICDRFIQSVLPGEKKAEGDKIYGDCERCTLRKQGHYVAEKAEDLAIR